MFSDKEIAYMQSVGLKMDFNRLSDSDWITIEDVIGNKLVVSGLDENYNPNDVGIICESILDKIP